MPEDLADSPLGEPRTVLVCEDEVIVAWDVAELVTAAGYSVVGPAGTVQTALDLVGEHRPDLVLLDAKLGDEWATPVAQLLREHDIRFIVTSGCSANELAEADLLDGAMILEKPLREDQLVGAISDIFTPIT